MKKILTKKRDITFDLKVWQCDIWFSMNPGIPHSTLPLNYANPLNLFHLFSRGIDRCSSNEWPIYLHGNKTNTNNHMVSCVYTCIFLSIDRHMQKYKRDSITFLWISNLTLEYAGSTLYWLSIGMHKHKP